MASIDGYDEQLLYLQNKVKKFQALLNIQQASILQKPSKPKSAFLLFLKTEREVVKKQIRKINAIDLMKIIRFRWNNLAEQKQDLNEIFNQNMIQYQHLRQLYSELKNPKKPMTPYFKYFQSKFKQLNQQSPQITVHEASTLISQEWKCLDQKNKEEYIQQYQLDKVEYLKVKAEKEGQEHYEKLKEYQERLQKYEKDCSKSYLQLNSQTKQNITCHQEQSLDLENQNTAYLKGEGDQWNRNKKGFKNEWEENEELSTRGESVSENEQKDISKKSESNSQEKKRFVEPELTLNFHSQQNYAKKDKNQSLIEGILDTNMNEIEMYQEDKNEQCNEDQMIEEALNQVQYDGVIFEEI